MKLTAILAATLLVAVAAYAAPSVNIGVGLGWADVLWPAPSVGLAGNIAGPIGVMWDTHVAFFGAVPGWEVGVGSFSNLALTVDLKSHEEGPQFYLIGGLGTPAVAAVTQDGFGIEGFMFGWVAGFGMCGDGGGIRVIGYFTEGFFGVGVNAYLSLGL